jgi:hypothetical protein
MDSVCHPEAHSIPKWVFSAAVSSVWKGCGSNAPAKRLISSAVKVCDPSWRRSPTAISSKNFMLHAG